MGRLNTKHRSVLQEKFQERVSFHKLELKLYGHDIATFPSLVKPLLGRTIPEVLELMRPMFPILFPRLLPMMMPKVMPVMLARVTQRISMPDFMREQMPELMPKVVAHLMPCMIGDVVPLVTRPMIDHLRSGN
jgi:hypothetical protein